MLLTWVIEFDKAQNKDKLHRHKVLHEAQTLALVGIFINLRRQAIDYFLVFLKRNPKYFTRKSMVPFI